MSEASLFIKKCDNLTLSAQALSELLQTFSERNASLRFRVKGTSMTPFIRDRDVITVSPLKTDPLQKGQVVAYSDPLTKKVRIHRIIKVKGNSFLVKGDNAAFMDGLVPQESILGVVSRVERKGKKVFFGLGLERIFIVFISSRAGLLSLMKSIKNRLGFVKKRVG